MTSDVSGPYGFDLGRFRYLVAAEVKYLIRAREKFEPGFLGDHEVYVRWGLGNIRDDRDDPGLLLGLAAKVPDKIFEEMLTMGGSGGVPIDDPLGGFKLTASGFADRGSIEAAIEQLSRGDNVNWLGLADWDSLDEIRKTLDQLPHPRQPELKDDAGGSSEGPYPPDKFYFDGQSFAGLSGKPFALVAMLWFEREQTVAIKDLAEPVWGDHEKDLVSGGPINSLRTRANRFFEKHGLPFRVEVKGAYVRLVDGRAAV